MNDAAKPAPVPDSRLGALPVWDLGDLYPSRDGPEITADIERARAEAGRFAQRYEGKLAGLDGAGLAAALAAYEALDERLSRLMSYASLVYAGDMSDSANGRFYQSMQESVTDISSLTLFFSLELNRIEDAVIERQLGHAAMAHWAPWVRDARAFRPHQLGDAEEKLLHEKQVTGRAAWNRLFDETMAELRIPVAGKQLTSAEALHLLSEPDAALRNEAAHAFGGVMRDNVKLFALLTNTLVKDKEIEDRWRKFARPVSSRNLANRLEDEVVEALVGAVTSAYPRLAHRYYRLKARWFGSDQLNYWDRNAPLPDAPDRTLTWDEARDTVLSAYGKFSPEMAAIGETFFAKRWIDAPVRPGKSPGAFAHPTVPSAHPYLLVNYQGKLRDVMTLAHELGHGVHQKLAAERQGHLLADTPLTLAETASVFGEMLTFQDLIRGERDAARRRVLIAGKVEDMLNTVVRQIAFHEFETRLHDERRTGELGPEQIGEIWLATQRESLGPALTFDDLYTHYWAYIPHFVHSPFYVYAYAFGDCLVNSLYAVYQDAERGFAEKYLEMLRAGGSQHHRALLAPFGLDASDPAFWAKGLGLISDLIDQLDS
jgi:oligoendopeptidase F